MQGGAAFGNHDADARLHALHALALPALLIVACWCSTSTCSGATATRRSGRCRPRWRPRAPCRPGPTRRCATPSWALLACWSSSWSPSIARHGAPLESPADPTSSYLARPEWYFAAAVPAADVLRGPAGDRRRRWSSRGSSPALVFALPFLDGGATNHPRDRAARADGGRAGPAGADGAGRDRGGQGRARSGVREGARRGEGAHRDGAAPRAQGRSRRTATCSATIRCTTRARSGTSAAPAATGWPARAATRPPTSRTTTRAPGSAASSRTRTAPLYMGPAKIEKGMRPVEATPEEMDALIEYVYAETGAPDVDTAKAGRGRDLLSPKDCDTCHDLDGEGENDGPEPEGPRNGEVGRGRHRRRRPPPAVQRPEQDAEVPGQADRRGDRRDGPLRDRAEGEVRVGPSP